MPLPGTEIFFFQFLANNEEMLVGFNLFVNLNCLKKNHLDGELGGIHVKMQRKRGPLSQKVIFFYFTCICIYILLWHPPCAVVSGTAFA